jgi:hypothetical protein
VLDATIRGETDFVMTPISVAVCEIMLLGLKL